MNRILRLIGVNRILGIQIGLLPTSSLFRNYALDLGFGPILDRIRETRNCPQVLRVSK